MRKGGEQLLKVEGRFINKKKEVIDSLPFL